VSVRVRAPASTANLGPGFDCAAVALDLWNELVVAEGRGASNPEHLGIRAFALLAPPDDWSFAFTSSIPRARGLGSSASVIALGLVAACALTGRDFDAEELLRLGVELEGHADNLAAALLGGVCLTWNGRVARIAEEPPAVPVVLVPAGSVSTAVARASLPSHVSHEDAVFTTARAALLGAALATGSIALFEEALDDRLHEPHRSAGAPLLDRVRADPPPGAIGATISGSGPSVIVWAHADAVEVLTAELESRYPDVNVLALRASPKGAHAL
jgi:homoserine kinase